MSELSVTGICRLTNDAEVRKSSYGAWLNFGISAYRKNVREGKQDADFFDVELYVKDFKPELQSQFRKGRLLFIQGGQLRRNEYVGQDGQKKSKLSIVIFSYEFLKDEEKVVTSSSPEKEKPIIKKEETKTEKQVELEEYCEQDDCPF